MAGGDRAVIERALEYVERTPPRELAKKSIVLSVPTGYGKSKSAPVFAEALYERGLSFNLVHVLPLRAIVEDLYTCTYLKSLEDLLGISIHCKKDPPRRTREAVRRLAEAYGDVRSAVAYQMGDYLLSEVGGKKSPLFDALQIVTTFDSYSYTFLRIPLTEIFGYRKHYAIPRARLLTSLTVLDEAHVALSEGEDLSSPLRSFLDTVLWYNAEASVPTLVASATLNAEMKKAISGATGNRAVFFELCAREENSNNRVCVRDEEYEGKALGIKWVTGVIADEAITKKVVEEAETGRETLVVLDSVRRAYEVYEELRSVLGDAVLVHGKLSRKDRRVALDKAPSAKVVVATSVIEAGVDLSKSTLVTDARSPLSVVQRTGRVCRDNEAGEGCRDGEARVYIVKSKRSDGDLLAKLEGCRTIHWRLPYDAGDAKGYSGLLEVSGVAVPDVHSLGVMRGAVSKMFIESDALNMLLKEENYSLIKHAVLTQVLVKPLERVLEEEGIPGIVENSLTVELDYLEGFADRVRRFVVVGASEHEVRPVFVREDTTNLLRPKNYAQAVIEGFNNLKAMKPVFVGFELAEGAYRDGIGLLRL
ncbi:CRISPR-associated helicase Cas3' [Thermofilum pendens]